MINLVPNGWRTFMGETLNQIINVVNGTTTGAFKGNLTGNVTGNVTGNATGALNGVLGGVTPAAATVTNFTQNGTAVVKPQVVAATGSSISTVRACTGALVEMTTVATSAMGIRLPAWSTGRRVQVQNIGTTSGSVYPGTGARIGAAATNARTTIAKRKGSIFTGSSVSQTWEVLAGA